MKSVEGRIYLDTNVLRYFGTAFSERALDEDLRDRLLMSPNSVIELHSQLATEGAGDALSALQAIPRVYNVQHMGLLPSSHDWFRERVFDLPPKPETLIESISHIVNTCLGATTPEELRADSQDSQTLLNEAKDETAAQFGKLLAACGSEGSLPDKTHRKVFASSIADRAEISSTDVDYVDKVIDRLNALYVYEVDKLQRAAKAHDYNVKKHANDLLDAEQLVYLADPSLHFLTCDKGFKPAETSSQFGRVHIVCVESLTNYEKATNLIREILTVAG